MPNSERQLSRREREIMDIVYAHGRVTALDVVEHLEQSPSKTAVRTLLRILEDKGHLSHKQDGQTYVYRATRPRSKVGKSALRRVLSTFFDSSLERAVAAHLGDSASNISDEELDRITKLIEAARKKES